MVGMCQNYLLIITALAGITTAKNFGSINVDGAGTVYVIGPDWAAGNVAVHDNGFTLNGGGRIYFAKDPVDNFNADSYWQTPLLGKHFSYEISKLNMST